MGITSFNLNTYELLSLSDRGNLNDFKYLKQLYNSMETQVRSLTSFGIP